MITSNGIANAGTKPTTVGSTDTAAFLGLLFPNGEVFEVRSPKCPASRGSTFTATASGYFNSVPAATRSIADCGKREPPGVYVTINPVIPEMLGRSINKIKYKADFSTKDEHVIALTHLLIDIDSEKPASNLSASDEEMESALELGRTIRQSLTDAGWPDPIYGMSGNGCYLIYAIDLPNDPESTELVRNVLKALAHEHDTPSATVDTTTFNASRIAKIFGTVARKGDDLRGVAGIPDRPHRTAWFEPPTAPLRVVPVELLRDMASKAPEANDSQGTATEATRDEHHHHSQATGRLSHYERCVRYLATTNDAINGQHGSKPTFSAACICWRFGLNDNDARAAMQWYNDNKTEGEPWSEREIEHKLSDARKKVEASGEFGIMVRESPRNGDRAQLPANGSSSKQIHGTNGAAADTPKAIDPTETRITFPLLTCKQLDEGDYAEEFLIDGMLVAGQPGIFAGGKKCLKTNIVVDLGISLATATMFLGKFPVNRACRVLLMSAESGLATLQKRLRVAAAVRQWDLRDVGGLLLASSLPMLGNIVHMDAMRELLAENEIETLILDPAYLCMPTGGSESSLFAMGELLACISRLCQELGVTLLLVHHTRKTTIDPFVPPELESIAWAGFAEFARQWLLVGRRELYEPGSGLHRLWLNVGGSAA
jgi:hypothetical protein